MDHETVTSCIIAHLESISNDPGRLLALELPTAGCDPHPHFSYQPNREQMRLQILRSPVMQYGAR